MGKVRHLLVVLGDQLDPRSILLRDIDPRQDLVFMAEVVGESKQVWSHKARIVLFLSAMRHYHEWLRSQDFPVRYVLLDEEENTGSLAGELKRALLCHQPQKVCVVQPGEWRVLESLKKVCSEHQVPLQILKDTHFLCSPDEFEEHCRSRKQLRMEFFYREMRKRHAILMEGAQPIGGQWNFDRENRQAFGKTGPGKIPQPLRFPPDAITREVIRLVDERFKDHPGKLTSFAWAVTHEDAQKALDDFIDHRLPLFGTYQDAMWEDEPFLYHSLLSSAINLKLLPVQSVLRKAELAYQERKAPLAAVEGFIRQILGWREYVHGIYWSFMPDYLDRNHLQADHPLPSFYWTGQTDMHCLAQTIGQTLEHGYAHHIQRLMVTGLFALLLGVKPQLVHEWYLAVYVDAVEWVELPNTLGMSQYADGGLMASKPYIASGKYIQRMSNYCRHCRFDPTRSVGVNACPFTSLYWDFLDQNRTSLSGNPRMEMQLRNLQHLSENDLEEIRAVAGHLKKDVLEKTNI